MKWNDDRGAAPPARPLRSATLTLLLFLLPVPAGAAGWRVFPVRLDIGHDTKSGAVTVANDSGDRVRLRMKAFEWSQDAEGGDRYGETGEILLFPRQMVLERKEEKTLRAGVRLPAAEREKTFRLSIEEIRGSGEAEGDNVAVGVRFDVPIFVMPSKEEVRGEVGPMTMSAGVIVVPVRNTGNVHFVVRSVFVRGKNGAGEEIYSRELGGWDLLSGAFRAYTTTVPPGTCGRVAVVEAEINADRLPMVGRMVVERSMCGP